MSQGEAADPGARGPRVLQQELAELRLQVEAQQNEDVLFRKANAPFNQMDDETTRLLFSACEKLAQEKEAVERSNFEEHTSSLPYLCRHFGTSIGDGLSEHFRDSCAFNASAKDRKRGSTLFALCCQSEFPPSQAWWAESAKMLTPTYEVLREKGRMSHVEARQLGPGEIFHLRAGQRSPLDARVLVHKGAVLHVQPTREGYETRGCTTEATARSAEDSANIVPKDSVLLQGELFCMAVRSSANALVSSSSSRNSAETKLVVDLALPSGLSQRQCRALFQKLCTKARLVCRSFDVVSQLARAKSLVVLLSRELFNKSSLAALVTVCKGSGRALVLVDCDCGVEQLLPCCQEMQLEHVDLGPLADTPAATTAFTSPGDSYSVSPTNSETPAPVRETRRLSNSTVGYRPQISEAERARLHNLAEQLTTQRDRGVVLSNLSGAGVQLLCDQLADHGAPPLYAAASFFHPEVFMKMSQKGSPASPPPKGTMATQVSLRSVSEMVESEPPKLGTTALGNPKSTRAPTDESGWRGSRVNSQDNDTSYSSEVSGVPHYTNFNPSLCASASLEFQFQDTAIATPGSTAASDPSKLLDLERLGPPRSSVAALVAIGTFGILAERSDAVFIRVDLACLAQALEVVSKVKVPEPALAKPAKTGV